MKKQQKPKSKAVRAWAVKDSFRDGPEYRVFIGWPRWQVLDAYGHELGTEGLADRTSIVRVKIEEV